jgi:hypothetical protein
LSKIEAMRQERQQGVSLPSRSINLVTGGEELIPKAAYDDFCARFPGVRPYVNSVMTQDVRDGLVERMRDGNYLHVAAMKVGVPLNTVKHWLRQAEALPGTIYSIFRDDLNEAIADAEGEMVQSVREAAKAGPSYWTAAAWWLERTKPDQYAQVAVVKNRVEHEVQQFMRHLEHNLPPDIFKMVVQAALKGNTRMEPEPMETIEVDSTPALPEAAR